MKKRILKVKIQLEMKLSFAFNELGELVSAGVIDDNHAVKTSVVSFEQVMQNEDDKKQGKGGMRAGENNNKKTFG